MRKRLIVIGVAARVMALVFALGTGVAGAAKGGNSANAKKCQGMGYLDWTTSEGATFGSAGACTAYAARGGTLTPKPTTDFHSLTVNLIDIGGVGGSVAIQQDGPPTIVCDAPSGSSSCGHNFPAGSTLVLILPSTGVWTVCPGVAVGRNRVVTMDSDLVATAFFGLG
jgi:hypothetical protein